MKPDDFAPDKSAVVMGHSGVVLSYGAMTQRSRRLARHLSCLGLRAGDVIALLFENRPEFFEVVWGAHRLGLSYTLLNWHLNAEEVSYILQDSGARAIVVSDRLAALAGTLADQLSELEYRLLVGESESLPGFASYRIAIGNISEAALDEELEGQPMLYSSGTTGRPKGVKRDALPVPFGTTGWMETMMRERFAFDETSVFLCPAPLYHAAPLAWSTSAQRMGATVVVMEEFDATEALRLIERYGVTHLFMVPTHFVRLLKLPDSHRNAFDLSSLRFAIHAGAPCPVEVKERMLDWWGPVIHEFYSCSEGIGLTMIGPEEWRMHPGSVGRPVGCKVIILDERGCELQPCQEGLVYFEGGAPFSYHNDPEKTAAAYDEKGRATVRDTGYLDEDNYLYLTGRASHMIISGGANIYPQEVENVLTLHPDVLDVAVIGVQNDEFGEEVKAVVVPASLSRAGLGLADELIAYCRSRLAHYKCPRSVDFVQSLPRLPTGKLAKRLLQDRYGAPPYPMPRTCLPTIKEQ